MIYKFLKKVCNYNKSLTFNRKWRKANKHNFTNAARYFDIEKVSVGKNTYGNINPSFFGNDNERLIIGSYCSIANGVEFLMGGEHHINDLMTYPFKMYLCHENDEDDRLSKGAIIVKDDVWIGRNVLILSGVTIGQGAVIAAGSVVTKDVPPYAIYTTNKIIKYRFSKEIIDKLLEFDFSKLDFEFVKNNIELFYNKNIEEIINNSNLKEVLEGTNGGISEY